jgi:TM2 domain-containing membrane protein YozV
MRYRKALDDAYLLAFPLGFLGVHRFYLGQPLFGFLYAFTCGLFVVGWLLDLIRLPRMVKEYNWRLEQSLMSRTQAACPEYDERRGGGRGVEENWSGPMPDGGRSEDSARRIVSEASWDVNRPASRQNSPYYNYSPGTPVHVPRVRHYEIGGFQEVSYTSFPSPSRLPPPVLPHEDPPPYSR